jgi:hypothetical protein
MTNLTRNLLFPFALFISVLVAAWIFSASSSEALTFVALALAIAALFVQILMFVIQAEQASGQQQQSRDLFEKTTSTLAMVKENTSTVQYLISEQVSRVIDNLLATVSQRSEPIRQDLGKLDQYGVGQLQDAEEMGVVLHRMRRFLEDLPSVIRDSMVDKHVSDTTGMTVGSSAWFDHEVSTFYDTPLSPDQSAFALVVTMALSGEESRVLRIVGSTEVQRRQLVTYPLWQEAWDTIREPTELLVRKGLLMGAESGTYFLTPTGRLAFRYLAEHAQ